MAGSLILFAGFGADAIIAATPEDLAMPVRKGAAKSAPAEQKPAAVKSSAAAATKSSPSKSSSPAAAKPSSRSTSKSASAKKATTVAKPAPKKSTTTTSAKPSETKSKTSNSGRTRDVADAGDIPSSSEDGIDLPEPQIINNSTQFQVALPPPPPAQLPAESQGGFLRRLFGGNRQQTRNAVVAPIPWRTDYSTRPAGIEAPVVLTGNGMNGKDLPVGHEDAFRLSTLPTDFRPTDLMLIPKEWCYYGNPQYLRREAASSLLQMFNDAKRQGLNLQLVSGYRDYEHQLRLYNQSVSRRGPNQNMVARPGKSEHQLGTTADVTNGKDHLLKRSFIDTPDGRWLAANAGRYGWKMTVMRGDGPRSHADEPWHIRYLGSEVNRDPSTRNVVQHRPAPQRQGLLGRLGQMFRR